jgi:hypothetical protein
MDRVFWAIRSSDCQSIRGHSRGDANREPKTVLHAAANITKQRNQFPAFTLQPLYRTAFPAVAHPDFVRFANHNSSLEIHLDRNHGGLAPSQKNTGGRGFRRAKKHGSNAPAEPRQRPIKCRQAKSDRLMSDQNSRRFSFLVARRMSVPWRRCTSRESSLSILGSPCHPRPASDRAAL